MKHWVEVSCVDCRKTWSKRQDSLKYWKGRCSRCASVEIGSRPEVKAAMRANGIAVMARGKLPTHFNRKRGAEHHLWKGGITKPLMQIRNKFAMREWRKAVLHRDGFSCVVCGCKEPEELTTDHIRPISVCPEQAYDVDNGRTLCWQCHDTHGARTRYGRVVKQPSGPMAVKL